MDTFTRLWSVSSGTYSSRFGSVGTSAVALAARKLKEKLIEYAAHLLEVPADQLEFRDGAVRARAGAGLAYSIKDLAGRAHWNTTSMPDGMEPGLQATAVFGFAGGTAVDVEDRVNSSNTYGFIAEVMAVEVDPETAAIRILRYVTVHDAGTIVNPMIAEGQIYGGALHGLGGALFEELQYDEAGQFLTGTFMDYLVPTASEAPVIDIAHSLAVAADAARVEGARRVQLDDGARGHRQRGERRPRAAGRPHHRAAHVADATLGADRPGAPRRMKPVRFEYHAPTSLDEAVSLLARYGGEAKALAGGQSLMPLMNFRLSRPAAIVDLNAVPGLAHVGEDGGEVRIGAMTRQRAIEFSPLVRRALPLLAEATTLVGHLPIRSRGTIGGSLAHADPSAEYPAVLTALDGRVVVRGPRGERALSPAELFQTYLTTRWPPTSSSWR